MEGGGRVPWFCLVVALDVELTAFIVLVGIVLQMVVRPTLLVFLPEIV